MDILEAKLTAENLIKYHRRDDIKKIARTTIFIIDAFLAIRKHFSVTGAISEAQFESILNRLNNDLAGEV